MFYFWNIKKNYFSRLSAVNIDSAIGFVDVGILAPDLNMFGELIFLFLQNRDSRF